MLELEKGTYIILYTQGNNPYPLCKINPETFNSVQMQEIVAAYRNCMDENIQLNAVKTIEGYKTLASYSSDTAFQVDSLSILTKPTKTMYVHGETYDYTGIKVLATATDGRIFDVTEECSFTPANGSSVTITSQVTVAFRGKSTSFNVTLLQG